MNAFACPFQNGRPPGTPARMGVLACSRAATFSRAQSVSPCTATAANINPQNKLVFIASFLSFHTFR